VVTVPRLHERIVGGRPDGRIQPVAVPVGEVFRLSWTTNELGRWHTRDVEVVRWAAYDADGGWQGTFDRRKDAVDMAAGGGAP
jgi:hypothetical protein